MIEIIITVENREQVNAIVENLCDLEAEGTLDFAFDCKTVDQEDVPSENKTVPQNGTGGYVTMPEGLQQYADDIALQILFENYGFNTNGMWSKADIEQYWHEHEDGTDVYGATVAYGSYGGENTSHSVKVYFFQEDGEWNHSLTKSNLALGEEQS